MSMATLTISGVTSDESQWVYTWSTVTSPAGAPAPTFNPNGTTAAATTQVTVYRAGTYAFACAVSAVGAAVQQQATTVSVTPPQATVAAGGQQQFTATVNDQFGQPMAMQPTL